MSRFLFIVLTLCIPFFVISLHAQIMWEPPVDMAAAHFDNNHPRIAVDRTGNPLVIWGKNNDLQFTRWNGTAFTQPFKLNPGSINAANQDWMGPEIATHGDTVYVVYKQTPEALISSHIWCARSFDGGLSFDPPVQVENTGDSLTRFPTITTDDFGHPIIAFMKFNPTFGDARWVVTRSDDYGTTFSSDVKASGWSGPSSDVCDCCPGTIQCVGDVVTVIYRDNNINIRDNWAALSFDGGRSFSGGINVDQQSWNLQNCPASGPDGVIVGDTLYTISMNGATDDELVYFNKASISSMSCPPATRVTDYSDGLIQNYPRMANYGTAVAMLWRHSLDFNSQLGLLFSSDITEGGFPAAYDTVALSNVINADVALSADQVFVVWQDNISGTVKYKKGMYDSRVGINAVNTFMAIEIVPNPSSDYWQISGSSLSDKVQVELWDMYGKTILKNRTYCEDGQFQFSLENTLLPQGVYVITLSNDSGQVSRLVIKN